jgi:hypothetical protein
MWPSFHETPNLTPYDAIQPTVVPFGDPGYPVNSIAAPLAGVSLQMDFSRPDSAPEGLLNQAVWKSIKGAASPMPAPQNRLFVPGGRRPEPALRSVSGLPLESDDGVSQGTARLRDALRTLR